MASQDQATGQSLRPSAPAPSRTGTAVLRRNNLTSEEIHAMEQDEAKKTIAIAKDSSRV